MGLEDFRGLGQSHPFLAACFTVFLLSLAGIPATAGFMGKLFLFSAAIQSHPTGWSSSPFSRRRSACITI